MRHDPAVSATRRAVRAATSDLPAGSLVLVAVSGGADSLALAAALAHEGPRAAHEVGAVTVDHGLQEGSAQRAEEVAEVCAGLGLGRAEVLAVCVGTRGGPEAAARDARYAALRAAAARRGAAAVLLGHTADDQAETVVLGLARGSGARSLAGMRPVDGLYRRPLLAVRRAQTRAACAALGLAPWDDPHNTDPRFTRSRVRGDVVPVLEAALGPGVTASLARTADLLRADADLLDELAAKAAVEVDGPDGLDIDALRALPAALRTRVLRGAALAAGAPGGALAATHIGALDRLVTLRRRSGSVVLPGGLVAERRCDRLSFR